MQIIDYTNANNEKYHLAGPNVTSLHSRSTILKYFFYLFYKNTVLSYVYKKQKLYIQSMSFLYQLKKKYRIKTKYILQMKV